MRYLISLVMLFQLIACSSKIESIEHVYFEAKPCEGKCPVFNMSIDSNRNANYNAIIFNNQEGSFFSQLGEKEYAELLRLLKESDFSEVADKYLSNVMDLPGYLLEVKYNGGRIKKIDDYGRQAPKKLQKVYDYIFKLRDSQHWEKK
jgi:hypothetical protein